MMKVCLLIFLFCTSISPAFAQEQFSVYFDSNKYELTSMEKEKLNQWISENRSNKILAINGYADEDGTTRFNDSLAQKRVDFVFKWIRNNVSIREDFKMRSFGEFHRHSKLKAENRKVTITYLLKNDLACEDEILGIKKEIPLEITKQEVSYPEKLIVQNPNGTKSEYKLDTHFMKKMGETKIGESLKLENLNFLINTFIVVPESRSKMYELLLVLEKNIGLKIEIQGHLCCMPIDRIDLTTQRAKAIRDFLVFNGIDKSRLTYKGLGSSQPIYPLPEKNEYERTANRRVEIKILAN